MSPKSKTRRGRKPYRPVPDNPPTPSRPSRRRHRGFATATLVIAVAAAALAALGGLTAVMDMDDRLLLNTFFTAGAFAVGGWMIARSLRWRRVRTTAAVTGIGGPLLVAALMHPLVQAASMPLISLTVVAASIHVRLRTLPDTEG